MKVSSQSIRHIYFLVVSVVTLVMIITSLGYLLFTGIEAAVLRGDEALIKRESPPMLILNRAADKTMSETQKPVETVADVKACTEDTCTLAQEDKDATIQWLSSYQSWKDQKIGLARSRGIASALSFLIVSAPIFFIHYRIFRKMAMQDMDENKTVGAVTSTYYYIVSLGTLIVSVVFGALMINTVLRTWVVPDGNGTINQPIMASTTDSIFIDAVVSCQTQCGFTNEQIALAKGWKQDYEHYQSASQQYYTDWKVDMSRSIAAIIVTLPVFFIHWRKIRSLKHPSHSDQNQPTVGA